MAGRRKYRPVQATPEELVKFERYVSDMDAVVHAFVGEAKRAGVTLDYSKQSLDVLERYLLEKLSPGTDGDLLRDHAARYLGETFRKLIGGHWELCLKDPDYIYLKLPVVTGYSKLPIEFPPTEIIRNFLASRKPGMLKRAVEADE
jgi:hypothetical protein